MVTSEATVLNSKRPPSAALATIVYYCTYINQSGSHFFYQTVSIVLLTVAFISFSFTKPSQLPLAAVVLSPPGHGSLCTSTRSNRLLGAMYAI